MLPGVGQQSMLLSGGAGQPAVMSLCSQLAVAVVMMLHRAMQDACCLNSQRSTAHAPKRAAQQRPAHTLPGPFGKAQVRRNGYKRMQRAPELVCTWSKGPDQHLGVQAMVGAQQRDGTACQRQTAAGQREYQATQNHPHCPAWHARHAGHPQPASKSPEPAGQHTSQPASA